jgi:hypothetical protein
MAWAATAKKCPRDWNGSALGARQLPEAGIDRGEDVIDGPGLSLTGGDQELGDVVELVGFAHVSCLGALRGITIQRASTTDDESVVDFHDTGERYAAPRIREGEGWLRSA